MSDAVIEIPNPLKIRVLEEQIKAARVEGALFHPTNPQDAWYCIPCGVFGRGEDACWSCGSVEIKRQWVPRFGGGAQSVLLEYGSENVV